MKALAAALLLTASAAFAASDYETGMEARRRGDYAAARAAFERLLAADPSSGGALEGLALVALAEGRGEEALGYLDRWRAKGGSAYIQSLLARAYSRLGRRREQTEALLRQGLLDLTDSQPLRRADARLREGEPGVFVKAKSYKSLSQEGLETANPQRIVYEGRSIVTEVRAALGRGFSAVGGASVRQEAQRNDRRGFTYYDILEQTYFLGAEGRAARGSWAAQYGQSFLSDIKSAGVGRLSFSRVKLHAETEAAGTTLRVDAERAPYFLRGSGGSSYFALLREASFKAELESQRWGWDWLGRAAIYDYTSNVTLRVWSLSAAKQLGGRLTVQPGYSHSFQEFYGAGDDGRLSVMPYDRWTLRARAGEEGRWRAAVAWGRTAYRDANRLHDADAEGRAWLPGLLSLSAAYRFRVAEFAVPASDYRSTDERAHWLGPAWRRRWGERPLWTMISYEHGWLNDAALSDYEGNAWVAEIEWYRGRALSLQVSGRLADTTVRDESYSASLQARWSF